MGLLVNQVTPEDITIYKRKMKFTLFTHIWKYVTFFKKLKSSCNASIFKDDCFFCFCLLFFSLTSFWHVFFPSFENFPFLPFKQNNNNNNNNFSCFLSATASWSLGFLPILVLFPQYVTHRTLFRKNLVNMDWKSGLQISILNTVRCTTYLLNFIIK